MQRINKNEKKNVWLTGEDDHVGASITIASATFQVFNMDGVSVQDSGNATISDNSTVTPDVHGLVDTTDAGFTAGTAYEVEFVITVGSEVYRPRVPIKCVETRL